MKLKNILVSSVIAIGCFFALDVSAASINLATGQAADGTIQSSGGQLDAFWTQSGANAPANGTNTYTVAPGSGDWYDGWTANTPASTWIAANPDNANGNGAFTLTRTFDLTGMDFTSATLSGGQWGIDDNGTLYLNGNILSVLAGGSNNWTSLTSFSATSSDFVSGVNTIKMVMNSSDNYLEAARLEGVVSADSLPAQDLPEPSSVAILGLGLLGFAASRRKSAKNKNA